MQKYIEKLFKLMKKCKKSDDVPVAALIVKNNKIIACGYNKREKKYKVTNHAEIIAIEKANKKLKNYFLYDCDLYVTLKPCKMCEETIKASRINNVYYLLDKLDSKKEYNKTTYKKMNSLYEKKYQEYLREFFNKMR